MPSTRINPSLPNPVQYSNEKTSQYSKKWTFEGPNGKVAVFITPQAEKTLKLAKDSEVSVQEDLSSLAAQWKKEPISKDDKNALNKDRNEIKSADRELEQAAKLAAKGQKDRGKATLSQSRDLSKTLSHLEEKRLRLEAMPLGTPGRAEALAALKKVEDDLK